MHSNKIDQNTFQLQTKLSLSFEIYQEYGVSIVYA